MHASLSIISIVRESCKRRSIIFFFFLSRHYYIDSFLINSSSLSPLTPFRVLLLARSYIFFFFYFFFFFIIIITIYYYTNYLIVRNVYARSSFFLFGSHCLFRTIATIVRECCSVYPFADTFYNIFLYTYIDI